MYTYKKGEKQVFSWRLGLCQNESQATTVNFFVFITNSLNDQ